ncbi:Transmembrane and TPR repeat-containing protein 4 [Liparis tanakae]|uniref:Transmembrane and TPR repeat-containing protein 4 n=1 Tax=Liparis tanakae TaxID=230148 RepID=A0A4Z2GYQ1_9TELE|nr:Transmembrane and TPR repeat-containing protein 4 [Liparis tanakae]
MASLCWVPPQKPLGVAVLALLCVCVARCALRSHQWRLHPTYVHAMNNLGNIRKERSELTEAERLLAKAVSIQYGARRAATADRGAPDGAPS